MNTIDSMERLIYSFQKLPSVGRKTAERYAYKVLEMSEIDSNVYSGLAFGLGIERITMIKYGISDIRTLFENNVKFLQQFNRR